MLQGAIRYKNISLVMIYGMISLVLRTAVSRREAKANLHNFRRTQLLYGTVTLARCAALP